MDTETVSVYSLDMYIGDCLYIGIYLSVWTCCQTQKCYKIIQNTNHKKENHENEEILSENP